MIKITADQLQAIIDRRVARAVEVAGVANATDLTEMTGLVDQRLLVAKRRDLRRNICVLAAIAMVALLIGYGLLQWRLVWHSAAHDAEWLSLVAEAEQSSQALHATSAMAGDLNAAVMRIDAKLAALDEQVATLDAVQRQTVNALAVEIQRLRARQDAQDETRKVDGQTVRSVPIGADASSE